MTAPRSLLAPPGSPAARFRRRFLSRPGTVLALLVLCGIAAACALAPWIAQAAGHDPDAVRLLRRFRPPSAEHWLGTDPLGRDVFVRLLHGGRVSLLVGVAGAAAAAGVGTVVGLVAGYLGGRIDALLMRITDAVIALPVLPLYIVLVAVDPARLGLPEAWVRSEDAGLWRIVAVVALVGWTTTARLVRGAALSVREREFVRAAAALGAGPVRIMLAHVLPSVASPVVVAATLAVGNVILAESVLSFLGLGIQPPTPSWGNMLTGAQEQMWRAPWLAVWPGLCIFATVVCVNVVGDGLQDALDPRSELSLR